MEPKELVYKIAKAGGFLSLYPSETRGQWFQEFPIDEVVRVVEGEEGGALLYFIPSLDYTGNIHDLTFDELTSPHQLGVMFWRDGEKVAYLTYAEEESEEVAQQLEEWRNDLREERRFSEHKRYLEDFYDDMAAEIGG